MKTELMKFSNSLTKLTKGFATLLILFVLCLPNLGISGSPTELWNRTGSYLTSKIGQDSFGQRNATTHRALKKMNFLLFKIIYRISPNCFLSRTGIYCYYLVLFPPHLIQCHLTETLGKAAIAASLSLNSADVKLFFLLFC